MDQGECTRVHGFLVLLYSKLLNCPKIHPITCCIDQTKYSSREHLIQHVQNRTYLCQQSHQPDLYITFIILNSSLSFTHTVNQSLNLDFSISHTALKLNYFSQLYTGQLGFRPLALETVHKLCCLWLPVPTPACTHTQNSTSSHHLDCQIYRKKLQDTQLNLDFR